MDIFKQKRYLILLVVLLIIFNLATLIMIWLNKPQRPIMDRQHQGPGQETTHIKQLLKDELGFDETQIKQYLKMQAEQRKKVLQLQNEIQQIKKQMFDEVLKDSPEPTLSDSLLTLTQEKMVVLEQLTYSYLLELKNLCKPEQRDKLKFLIGEFFRQNPPGGINSDRPPPPPPFGAEQPPHKN
ncbi:MAG: hypothetical protein CVV23_11160 [Ignavibacteriae bacterium HGW-Ignavibacteriae-2]|jgi:hypothetical protein|nr:MAG: hypothetical protein CVV23_11160 [Ignavibacteriae bacterium HGW-Ignavibacteriae-2]